MYMRSIGDSSPLFAARRARFGVFCRWTVAGSSFLGEASCRVFPCRLPLGKRQHGRGRWVATTRRTRSGHAWQIEMPRPLPLAIERLEADGIYLAYDGLALYLILGPLRSAARRTRRAQRSVSLDRARVR
jgi:hypothetical protein